MKKNWVLSITSLTEKDNPSHSNFSDLILLDPAGMRKETFYTAHNLEIIRNDLNWVSRDVKLLNEFCEKKGLELVNSEVYSMIAKNVDKENVTYIIHNFYVSSSPD